MLSRPAGRQQRLCCRDLILNFWHAADWRLPEQQLIGVLRVQGRDKGGPDRAGKICEPGLCAGSDRPGSHGPPQLPALRADQHAPARPDCAGQVCLSRTMGCVRAVCPSAWVLLCDGFSVRQQQPAVEMHSNVLPVREAQTSCLGDWHLRCPLHGSILGKPAILS